MYKTQHYTRYLTVLACLSTLLIAGCGSTEQAIAPAVAPTNSPLEVAISADELAQLKASAQQWQQAKAGVERLLVIEQDLKLLITQLNAVANKPEVSPASSSAAAAPEHTSPTTPAQPTAAKMNNTPQPLFALQIAAVTDETRLSQSFNEIKASAADLFSGQFIANVETIDVKGVTYYRLKLGAYQYQNNADADCNALKQRQVSCIVSYYTEQPLKL